MGEKSDMRTHLSSRFALLALLLVIGGCAFVMKTPDNWAALDAGPKPDYEEAQTLAQSAIADSLFDPDSAKFKNWSPLVKVLYNYASTSSTQAVWELCVEVNGKNRFGGYVGYEWFYVKFRNGKPITDAGELGMGKGNYDCEQAKNNPARL